MYTSFLGIEGCHVFVTGASGGVGGAAVKEFLSEFGHLIIILELALNIFSKWMSCYSTRQARFRSIAALNFG
jgi:NAD(P)-dependent dehydrogenase (short-subunit alcohol dehydrogenase family)